MDHARRVVGSENANYRGGSTVTDEVGAMVPCIS